MRKIHRTRKNDGNRRIRQTCLHTSGYPIRSRDDLFGKLQLCNLFNCSSSYFTLTKENRTLPKISSFYSIFRSDPIIFKEINFHWSDSPGLYKMSPFLHIVSYNGIWRQLTSFGSAILTIFLKRQKITEINSKSSQTAYEMYTFAKFFNLKKIAGKKDQ